MESNYFITKNPGGVSIRLKSNNRVIRRIVLVLENDDDFANTGRFYPNTINECHSLARSIIAELGKVDSYRLLPKVKLPRSVDVLTHPKSLEE
jgi:hypothetical protein